MSTKEIGRNDGLRSNDDSQSGEKAERYGVSRDGGTGPIDTQIDNVVAVAGRRAICTGMYMTLPRRSVAIRAYSSAPWGSGLFRFSLQMLHIDICSLSVELESE